MLNKVTGIADTCEVVHAKFAPQILADHSKAMCSLVNVAVSGVLAAEAVNSVYKYVLDYSYDTNLVESMNVSEPVMGELSLNQLGLVGSIKFVKSDGVCYPVEVSADLASSSERCRRGHWSTVGCERWACGEKPADATNGHLVSCFDGGRCMYANCVPQTFAENQLQSVSENKVRVLKQAGKNVHLEISVMNGWLNYCYTADGHKQCDIIACQYCTRPQTTGLKSVESLVPTRGVFGNMAGRFSALLFTRVASYLTVPIQAKSVVKIVDAFEVVAEQLPVGTPADVLSVMVSFAEYGLVFCTDSAAINAVHYQNASLVVVHVTEFVAEACHIGWVENKWHLGKFDRPADDWVYRAPESKSKSFELWLRSQWDGPIWTTTPQVRKKKTLNLVNQCPSTWLTVGTTFYTGVDCEDWPTIRVAVLSEKEGAQYWSNNPNYALFGMHSYSTTLIRHADLTTRVDSELNALVYMLGKTRTVLKKLSDASENDVDFNVYYASCTDNMNDIVAETSYKRVVLISINCMHDFSSTSTLYVHHFVADAIPITALVTDDTVADAHVPVTIMPDVYGKMKTNVLVSQDQQQGGQSRRNSKTDKNVDVDELRAEMLQLRKQLTELANENKRLRMQQRSNVQFCQLKVTMPGVCQNATHKQLDNGVVQIAFTEDDLSLTDDQLAEKGMSYSDGKYCSCYSVNCRCVLEADDVILPLKADAKEIVNWRLTDHAKTTYAYLRVANQLSIVQRKTNEELSLR